MSRKYAITLLLFATLGALLASAGLSMGVWQTHAVVFTAIAIMFNERRK